MPYKVIFNWSGPDYDNKTLKSVSCDGQDIPEEDNWHSQVGEEFIQITETEAANACLTVNTSQTLQLHKGRFLYLDVGRWLGGQQTFGLVCGHEAVLCKYQPGSSFKLSVHPYQEPFLNEFLHFLEGVSVTNRMPIPHPYPTNGNHLYIILPDMHVPEAPSLALQPPPFPPGPPAPPPYILEELHHSYRNPAYEEYLSKEKARKDQYFAENPTYTDYFEWSRRDTIFDSRLSIPAMCTFLDKIRKFQPASQLSLIQVGDMYEMWAARPCLFEDTPAKYPYVDLAHDLQRSEADLANELGAWVGGTHLLWPELFQMFDACEEAGIQVSYLHGNHDNYMILPEVVEAANNYIQSSISQGHAEGIPQSWMKTLKSTKVHRRRNPQIESCIFIEHGQRVDSYNRDGSRSGHKMTQKAVGTPTLTDFQKFKKLFDPARRKTFVYGAAAWWLRHYGEFGLFVHGHTHTPVLEWVDVYHSREDVKEVMTSGGPIKVLGTTPLDISG